MATGEAYRILLFKDASNMAGIRESSSNEVYQQMDIVTHLPEAVQKVFSILVTKFIVLVHQFNRKELRKQREREAMELELEDQRRAGELLGIVDHAAE